MQIPLLLASPLGPHATREWTGVERVVEERERELKFGLPYMYAYIYMQCHKLTIP